MAGWAGFTDEDLMQIKHTTSKVVSPRQPTSAAAKQAMARKQKLQQQRELARQRAQDFAQSQNTNLPLPSAQRLHQPSVGKAEPHIEQLSEPVTGPATVGPDSQGHVAIKCESESVVKASADDTETEPDASVKEIDEQEGLSKELSRMEQFRLQQQKMEEENKERRRKLADAIKQRSKLAKEEANKLTKVQKELSHLDSLVNADVSIIRDKIEAASIDFLQAQKRYERAEKEFVEAKMVLAEKSDLKESLTEHLYTIIQQNEVRKAERLAVLMKELGLEAEDCPNTLSSVPPLLSFSPINTLHRPSAPSTPTAIAVSPTATQPVQSPVEEAGGESEKQSPEGEKEKETGHSEDVNAEITGGANGEGSSEAASETAQDKSPDSKGPDRTVEADSKVTTKAPVENGAVESQDGGAEPAAAPST